MYDFKNNNKCKYILINVNILKNHVGIVFNNNFSFIIYNLRKLKLLNYFYINYIIYNSNRYKKAIKCFSYLFIFELCMNNL